MSEPLPLPISQPGWLALCDMVDTLVDQPSHSIEDFAFLAELYGRVHPVMCEWASRLDRINQQRVTGRAGIHRDPQLEELYDRLAVVVGRLQPFARFANAGTPENPWTIEHERFAAAVAAERARTVREQPKQEDQ